MDVAIKEIDSAPYRTEFEKLDRMEAIMFQMPQTEIPVRHLFSKGMYVREIVIPAETLLTSKIHKTQHPFVVSKGKLSVVINGEVSVIEAPYTGITEPNTRRIACAFEETVWTTFHPLPYITGFEGYLPEAEMNAIIERIEAEIIEPRNLIATSEEIKLLTEITE